MVVKDPRTRTVGFRNQSIVLIVFACGAIPETQTAGDIYVNISSEHYRGMRVCSWIFMLFNLSCFPYSQHLTQFIVTRKLLETYS